MSCARRCASGPHYHLGVLAVHPDRQGKGVGRVLLDALHRLSASDPASTGVSLNTEKTTNVELYRHVGYRVIGEAGLADGAPVAPESAERGTLHTWCLFRPDDPA
jgi:ribosomal protein S18 acetylase RimI-like enzyme